MTDEPAHGRASPAAPATGDLESSPTSHHHNVSTTSLDLVADCTEPIEIEAKAGNIRKLTFSRYADCQCTGCDKSFDSTGTAASHARASRHVMAVTYTSKFSFVPIEQLPKSWTR